MVLWRGSRLGLYVVRSAHMVIFRLSLSFGGVGIVCSQVCVVSFLNASFVRGYSRRLAIEA